MCGRFTLRTPLSVLAQQFLFDLEPHQPTEFAPRHNIAPTQTVAVVRKSRNLAKREFAMLHWGLVPSWAKDLKSAAKMINARCETAAEKPAFRTAFSRRRCLILADGFYEWKKEGNRKIPHLFELPGSQPFAFAGLWESWRGLDRSSETPIETCTILTTAANAICSALHDRMPVIIEPADYETWLNPEITDAGPISRIIHSTDVCQELTLRPVGDPAKLDRELKEAAASTASETPLFDSLAN
jgi:putative SOS response-associated peptidase YedK